MKSFHCSAGILSLLLFSLSIPLHAGEPLTFDQRVEGHLAIERVYYEHRIWPADNPGPKPPFEVRMPEAVVRAKAEDSLRMTAALRERYGVTITAADLQAEMDRMTRETRDAATLKELFAALSNDPHRIAECLARPLLADRMLHERFAADEKFLGPVRARAAAGRAAFTRPDDLRRAGDFQAETHWLKQDLRGVPALDRFPGGYREVPVDLPQWEALLGGFARDWGADPTLLREKALTGWISPLREEPDRFSVTAILKAGDDALWTLTAFWMKTPFDPWWEGEAARFQAAVPEPDASYRLSSIPSPRSSDSWSAINDVSINCPTARYQHIFVCSGPEIVVWGGINGASYYNSGGRYYPATNSWLTTSQDTNCPTQRTLHTGVWDGAEVLIWSGTNGTNDLDNGGRYNPADNTWLTIPSTGLPAVPPRHGHRAFGFSGGMLIYGGYFGTQELGHGGLYLTPPFEEWEAITNTNGPGARADFTFNEAGSWAYSAVWGGDYTNTGSILDWGGVDPVWRTISTSGAPTGRSFHTAVSYRDFDNFRILLVWGGSTPSLTNTGGIYDFWTDTWQPTSTTGAPAARMAHTAVTDFDNNIMIVWGGVTSGNVWTNTGGIYNSWTDTWQPTSTTGAPAARNDHTAVWAGESMFVWGGRDAALVPLKSGGIYSYCAPPQLFEDETHQVTAWDPDKCAVSGLRVSWGNPPMHWGDYDLDTGARTIDILRDGSVVASGLAASPTYYIDTSAVPNTEYRYQVRYNNSCGSSTTSSMTGPVKEYPYAPVLNGANNSADDIEGCADTGVQIKWPQDPADWGDGGTGTRNFMIRRSDNQWPGGVLAYSTTSYTDTTGNNGTSYLYQVRYINGCGASYYTFTTGASAADDAGGAPTVSVNNTAVDDDGCLDTGVRITWPVDPGNWKDGGAGTRTYDVLRAGSPIASGIAYGTTAYTDTTGENGTTYAYRVRYNNGCGGNAQTAGVSAADDVGAAPSGLTNNTAADLDPCADTGVQITWTKDAGSWGDNNSGTRTYDVLRDGAAIASGIAYNTTSHTDTTGANGTSYSYTVRYNNGCGLNAVTGGASAADNVKSAPSGLTNNAAVDLSTCADTGVQITWTKDAGSWGDNNSGTRTYDVLRDGGAIASGLAYNTTSFTDTTGVNGTTYSYKVRYNNGCGLSAETTGVSAKDLAPSAPSSLSNNTAADLSPCADTGVLITWTLAAGAWGDNGVGTRTYDVLRDGVVIASGLDDNTNGMYDFLGVNGTSYSYQVRYVNGCGLSAETAGAAAADSVNPTMLVDAAYTPATPGWGIDHFASIQSGINAACIGAEVTVAAGTYAESVTLNKNSTVSLGGRVTIAGSLTLNAGTWTSTSSVLTLTGNFANNGATFNANGGTVLIGGTVDHTVGGSAATPFNNLYLNDSLQGYWKLDDGSGSAAADSSGSGLDGTLNGPAWSTTVAPVQFADTGSLSFDGNNDVVSAPLATPATDNITLSVWARWTGGLGVGQIIFYNGNAGANGYGLYLQQSTGYKITALLGGKGLMYTTAELPTDGSWRNLILVRRSGTWELYINGIQQPFTSGISITSAPNVPADGTYIGNTAILNGTFNGLIDEARIYSRALSAPEITALGTGHIPLGYVSVTTLGHALDVNGTLRLNSGRLDVGPENHAITVGKNWAHNGGDFLPRGGAVTLDGAIQAVTGEPAFNHFTVNPGAAVTLPVGTMTVAGDFTNNGTVASNGGTVSFTGVGTQTLTGNTAFANLIIGTTATLATTYDATVGGTLTNNGWTQETKSISTAGTKAFGLAAVTVNTTTQGTLSSLQIKRRDQNHFNATSNEQTGRYWIITPTGSGYAADLTIPQDGLADPRACRYGAGIWDCVRTSFTSSTVTRNGVTAFSDWAAGKGDTVPPPPPVGNGNSSTTAATFKKDGSISTQIDVTYDATHCTGQKAVILYGMIGSYGGYFDCAQSDAGNGGTATINAEVLDNVWFNIVWTTDNIAGHPGFASIGGSETPRTWNVAPYCGVFTDSHADSTCP